MRKLPGLSYIKSTAHSSNTKHREHTVRQLKYSEYTAIAPPILQQYGCVHRVSQLLSRAQTKHRKYTASQLKYWEYTAILL